MIKRACLILILLLLAACDAGQEEAPSPTAAPIEAPVTVETVTLAAPTPLPPETGGGVDAPPGTGEALAATAEAVVSTLTPVPTSTAPASTPTPSLEGLIAPPFPENVNPLTGETVADPAVLQRRPIAVKISNYPPVVRPQAGLNRADLVFEHYAEGGVTRFTALFYGQDADPVGSIRSGRLIDLEIPKMYDAAFAYSGSSGPVRLMMRESVFFERIVSPDFGHGGFYRIPDPNKAFEHTLFTDTPRLRAILEERGQNRPPEFGSHLVFSEEPPAGGLPGSRIEVRYIGTNAFWLYDPASGRYRRSTDGQPHLDANTNNQLSFRNVVVLAAHHEDTDILEDQVGGGHYSIQIQVWGDGPVTIFRDGQRFDGRWRREAETEMVTFYDLEGNRLPLGVGNSFIQLVPLGFTGLVVQ